MHRPLTLGEAQEAMLEAAIDLLRLGKRLRDLQTAIPVPHDALELAALPHLGLEIRATLEAVRRDELQRAIDELRTAAELTEEDLRRNDRARRLQQDIELF